MIYVPRTRLITPEDDKDENKRDSASKLAYKIYRTIIKTKTRDERWGFVIKDRAYLSPDDFIITFWKTQHAWEKLPGFGDASCIGVKRELGEKHDIYEFHFNRGDSFYEVLKEGIVPYYAFEGGVPGEMIGRKRKVYTQDCELYKNPDNGQTFRNRLRWILEQAKRSREAAKLRLKNPKLS